MKKYLLLTLLLLISCGKEPGIDEQIITHNDGLKNQNSFFKEGFIHMTTNDVVDSNYHRWQAPFTIELPGEIEVYDSTGPIDAKLVISDNTDNCEYHFDGTKFVFDSCSGGIINSFTIGSCLFLRIEGTRNFTVKAIFKEI